MKIPFRNLLVAASLGLAPLSPLSAAETNSLASASRLLRPLSLTEALDLALQQNSSIRKSVADLEATQGVIVQTRAIAVPKVGISSSYSANEDSSTDKFTGNSTFANSFEFASQRWSADIRITQSIYEGGRIQSALRSTRLTREQSLLQHEAVLADVLRDVRLAYYGALMAQQQISVQEASLKLLQQELEETQRRFNAGTVPKFNVLRAEVEVANARPRLIRARNAFRIAKENLANALGENVPGGTDELALQLTDKLEATPYAVKLSEAVTQGLTLRPELKALRKAEALRAENVVSARSGYKPSVQVFAGYNAKSSSFSTDLTEELHGWEAGAQLSWNIFDGFITKGRIQEAQALQRKTQEEIADVMRRIELEVRTAYSGFVEAQEVLVSQEKVQESAEEALRLATVRAGAGSATQLDVLNAQTALTEARNTQIQALHDYAVAKAKLERAIGQPITKAPTEQR